MTVRNGNGSIVELTDMVGFEEALREPTIHSYPKEPPYRISGNWNNPQPGDVALCGHVKLRPAPNVSTGPTCSECARLKRMLGYA